MTLRLFFGFLLLIGLIFFLVPRGLWAYHTLQAVSDLNAGLGWPGFRQIDSVPKVKDVPALQRALDSLAIARRFQHKQALTYRLSGEAYVALEQWPQAVNAFEQAYHFDSDNPLIIRAIISAYAHMQQAIDAGEGNQDLTSIEAEQFVANDPQSRMWRIWQEVGYTSEHLITIGEQAEQGERYIEAREAYLWAIAHADSADIPLRVSAMAHLGRLFNNYGEWDKAVPLLEEAVKLLPSDALANHELARAIYETTGDVERARILYEAAASVSPDSPWIYSNLAKMYYDENDMNMAIFWARQGTEAAPDAVSLWILLADLTNRINDLREAEAAAKRAVELAPGNMASLELLATVYCKSGDWEACSQTWLQALAIDSENPNYLLNLAQAYRQLGEDVQAIEVYERIIVIDSTNKEALEALDELRKK